MPEPSLPEPESLKVFLSYSRKDLAIAERLRETLNGVGFEAYLDKHDILPGEPWQERLAGLIAGADTVCFLISPDSVGSTICDWELNEAERLEKRILPVVVRPTGDRDVPGRLRRLNYIFLRPEDPWQHGVSTLLQALRVDVAWIREHTRLGELAARWMKAGRPHRLLLSGVDIMAAEHWRDGRTGSAQKPTTEQLDFIQASRQRSSSLNRRWAVGTSAIALLTTLLGVLANEARVSAGLTAIEAQLAAESLTISAALGTRDQGRNLARAVHAYATAERELGEAPAPVWNALRQAFEQTRVTDTVDLPGAPDQIALLEDGGVVILEKGGAASHFSSRLELERAFDLSDKSTAEAEYGFTASMRAIWQRDTAGYRVFDTSGSALFGGHLLEGASQHSFDVGTDCWAQTEGAAVTVHRATPDGQSRREVVIAPGGTVSEWREIRTSADCSSVLAVSEKGPAALVRWESGGVWTTTALQGEPDEAWAASRDLMAIATHFPKGTDINVFDTAAGDWRKLSLLIELDAIPEIKGLRLASNGSMAVDFGKTAAVFDSQGRLIARVPTDIVGAKIDLPGDAARLALLDVSRRSLSLLDTRATKLTESITVYRGANDAGISALASCAPGVLAMGDDNGRVVIVRLESPEVVTEISDARELVRRIECRDGSIAAIVSDAGILALRGQPHWLSNGMLGAGGFGGAATFALSKGTWLRISESIDVLDATGAVLRSVPIDVTEQAAPRSVSFDWESSTLFILGDAVEPQNGDYGARAQIWNVSDRSIRKVATITDRRGLYYSAGARIGGQHLAVAGLPGRLAIADLGSGAVRRIGGAAQFVPFALAPLGPDRFAFGTSLGEVQVWTVDGVRLRPDIAPPLARAQSVAAIAPDPSTGELFVTAGDGRVLRTVLSGPRLKERACAQLARLARRAVTETAGCTPATPRPGWQRRFLPIEPFRALSE